MAKHKLSAINIHSQKRVRWGTCECAEDIDRKCTQLLTRPKNDVKIVDQNYTQTITMAKTGMGCFTGGVGRGRGQL